MTRSNLYVLGWVLVVVSCAVLTEAQSSVGSGSGDGTIPPPPVTSPPLPPTNGTIPPPPITTPPPNPPTTPTPAECLTGVCSTIQSEYQGLVAEFRATQLEHANNVQFWREQVVAVWQQQQAGCATPSQ